MEPRVSIITLGVEDLQKSFEFYHINLKFPCTGSPSDGIIFFKTSGTCLALYPLEKLIEDIGETQKTQKGFSGITLAHNVREKHQVSEILSEAENAGAKIIKPAIDTFWGGHSGYFRDLDGYLWEVAWGAFDLNEQGNLIIT